MGVICRGLQISKRRGKSDSSNVNYTNTNILANSGTININSTNNDTNISGANVNADNIIINSGNNLNVASLQNTSVSKSKSKSVGAGGGSGSGSLSYNSNKSSFERDWVDDQTNIVAQNNLTINTGNNTDVKGALIASNNDNLLINTGTLTYSDIIDTEKQESSGFGISTNISVGESSRNPDAGNPNQDKNYYPNGSTTLSLQNEGYEKEQVTRAVIENGTINITDTVNRIQDIANLNRDVTKAQEVTKDTITGALNVSATVDNRLIAAAFGSEGAQDSLVKTIKDGPKNLANALEQNALLIDLASETLGEVPLVGGITRNVVTSIPEGILDYFYEDDSRVYDRNGNIVSATSATNYLVNGVMNDKEGVMATLNEKGVDAVVRHNPTSGALGDLIESGLGKTLGRVLPGTNKVATLVAGDLYERKDMIDVNNVFHSQGSIIGDNAMRYYNDIYDVNGSGTIHDTQRFIAVGPAVGKNIWHNTTSSNIDRKKDRTSLYVLDPRDPVEFLTSPGNLLNDVTNPIQQKLFGSQNNLPYILPNPVDTAKGIYKGVTSPSAHIMTNELYLKYIQNNNSNNNSQNNNP